MIRLTLLLICIVAIHVNAQEWTQIGNTIYGGAQETKIHHQLSNYGRHLAIGSIWGSGFAQVYFLQGNTWVEKGGKIDASTHMMAYPRIKSINDDGSVIALGGLLWSDPNQQGVVKVYQYNSTTELWEQKGNDIIGGTYEQLGTQVRLSSDGNKMVISGDGMCCIGVGGPGKVYFYSWDGSNWVQGEVLQGENTDDEFGGSIYISKDWDVLAVEASNFQNSTSKGKVYVFENVGGVWQERLTSNITPIHINGMDLMGMSEDGSNVVVIYRQKALVFQYNGTEYIPKGDTIVFSGQNWGFTSGDIDQTGSLLVLGDYGYTGDSINQGKVKMYRWNQSTWQPDSFEVLGYSSEDYCGDLLRITNDGNTVSVNSFGEDYTYENEGAVRVFKNLLPVETRAIHSRQLRVYPNPSNKNFFIENLESNDQVVIYNNLGIIVYNQIAKADKNLISANLPTGVYFIHILEKNELIDQIKMVIQ